MRFLKVAAALLVAMATLLALVSCGGAKEPTLDGTYIRKNAGGDFFSITFTKDGTFEYTESPASRGGKGTYKFDGEFFILTDETARGAKDSRKTYRFKLVDDILYYFIAGSDNFANSPLPDGAAFGQVGDEY